MWNKQFRGWYFKHQRDDDMISFIPGRAESGAFVQMLALDGARQFNMPELTIKGGCIHAGNCLFSPDGCKIDLPGVRGEIRYGTLLPLKCDIMGPFRFFPMECRHGIISMAHTLQGSLIIDGQRHCFDGGTGYIETDSGTSFPSSYQWLQCNHFSQPCSLMISIAHIPFCAMHFTGCICTIVYGGREYFLATYRGVRILNAEQTHIRLRQGDLLLDVEIAPSKTDHALRSPVKGKMTGIIREGMNAEIRACLRKHGKIVFDLQSPHAAYENVPPPEK